jgi:hypothetical protein
MIEDQIFDVVTLEFFPWKSNLADFVRLAKRIRARFPSAVIIFLHIHIIYRIVRYKGRRLRRVLRLARIKSPSGPAFEQFISGLSDSDFTFVNPGPDFSEDSVVDSYQDAMKSVGGHFLEFPKNETNAKNFFLESTKYFGNPADPFDEFHLSILGHQKVAEKIRQLLSEVILPLPSNNADSGDWGGGKDQCVSWFENGNVDGVQHTNMSLVQFSEEKWALEVDQAGGEIVVKCSFRPCEIFINHMFYGPFIKYPRVHIEVNGKKTLVTPNSHYPHHMSRLAYCGTSDVAATFKVTVTPLMDDVNKTEFPFRITGIATSPQVL